MASFITTSRILAAGLAAAIAAAAANAEAPQSSEFNIAFSYDRAELESADGAAKMLARMENQVRKECRAGSGRDLSRTRITQECIDATMQDTLRKIGSETLVNAYETRRAG